MIRYAFHAAGVRVPSLHYTALRFFGTNSRLSNKARVDQVLEQAQSASPQVYKTVKEKTGLDDKSVRREQLIWLIKHSLGKDSATATKVSPHDPPWETEPAVESASGARIKKTGRQWEGVTVWPHLW